MIKATAGGGGRGMRTAHNEPSLKSAFHSARHEAQKAFGTNKSIWKSSSIIPITLNFRSSPTATVASCISANAIAPFSAKPESD